MQVIAAVAEFERLPIERTQAGINSKQGIGQTAVRRPSLNEEVQAAVVERLDAGNSVSEIARIQTTRQTIIRVRKNDFLIRTQSRNNEDHALFFKKRHPNSEF